jgi:hypothetical protein
MPTSWKTTAAGILPIVGGFYDLANMFLGGGAPDGNKLMMDISIISAGLIGLFAKDHNVSNAPAPVPAKTV